MATILFEKDYVVYEKFTHFTDREVRLHATLYSDERIEITSEWFKVEVTKGKTTRFKTTGKGCIVHRRFVDQTLTLLLEDLHKSGVKAW